MPINDPLGILTVHPSKDFVPQLKCNWYDKVELWASRPLLRSVHFFLPRALEIGFHPFIRGLSASAPRVWCVSLFLKPFCKYQPFRANSKISYKVGNWHASPPLGRGTAAAKFSFLQRRRLRADLITTFKISTGLLDIVSNLFFLPPARRGLRGHSYKVLQGATHPQLSQSIFFKKRLEKVWTEIFPNLSH